MPKVMERKRVAPDGTAPFGAFGDADAFAVDLEPADEPAEWGDADDVPSRQVDDAPDAALAGALPTAPAILGAARAEAAAAGVAAVERAEDQPEAAPTDTELARGLIAAMAGTEEAQIERIKLDLRKLARDAIAGDIDTRGGSSLMLTIDLYDLGAWRPEAGDAERALSVRNPQISLLPRKWVEKLRWPLQQARLAGAAHGFRLRACDPVVGPTYRFYPWTSFPQFKTAFDAACKKLDEVKAELCQPATYAAAVRTVREEATRLAETSAKNLEAQGVAVADDFVPRFVGKVMGRVPSPDWIMAQLRIVFRPAILEFLTDSLDEETAVAQREARLAEIRAANQAKAAVLADMDRFVQAALKDALPSLSPLAELVQGVKASCYRALRDVRAALDKDGALGPTEYKRVEQIAAEVARLRDFLDGDAGDGRLEALVDDLLGYATIAQAARDQEVDKRLRATAADLQALCAAAVRELEEAEALGLGAVEVAS